MTKIEQLKEGCKSMGIHISSYSPGDGVTRYSFRAMQPRKDHLVDYGLFEAFGIKEARIFAHGLQCGFDLKERYHV